MVSFCSISDFFSPKIFWYNSCLRTYVYSPTARVHFQHSAELLSRLVKVEANYSLQLYPDEGHILREPRTIQHFQRTVVNYLQNCFKHSTLLDPVEDDEEEEDWVQSSVLFFWKDSLRTVCHLMHYLGLDYQAQEHRSGDQTHQIASYNFWKNSVLYNVLNTIIFGCFIVRLRPCLFTKFTRDDVE